MQTTITPQNIAAAEAIGPVDIHAPDAIHINIDADRGAQIMTHYDGFDVRLNNAWFPLSSPRKHVVPTFADALAIVRNFV